MSKKISEKTYSANWKIYALLHAVILLYSFSPICSKFAGRHQFPSVGFVLFYGLAVIILALYALLWQQIIKRMPLTTAYANKAVTVVWGMIGGVFFFDEQITYKKIAGLLVVLAGVVLYSIADGNGEKKQNAD